MSGPISGSCSRHLDLLATLNPHENPMFKLVGTRQDNFVDMGLLMFHSLVAMCCVTPMLELEMAYYLKDLLCRNR
jgi:hypothetical protein